MSTDPCGTGHFKTPKAHTLLPTIGDNGGGPKYKCDYNVFQL